MTGPDITVRDFSSVVVLWSQDGELVEELAIELSRRDPGIEVHAVHTAGVLAEHIGALKPDAVIVDIDTTRETAALALAAGGTLARVPTIILGVDAQSASENLPAGARPVDFVERNGAYMDGVTKALTLVYRTVGLADRMQETVQHYRDILAASGDGIFVLVNGLLTYVNPAFANTLGKPVSALVGLVGLADLVPAEDRKLFAEELSRVAVQGGRDDLIDARLQDASGGMRRFEISCRASLVEGQRAIVGVARDVTATREMQDEIDRARARAAQIERLRALGELAAGVAHDFNNVLETVLGRLSLARGKLARGQSPEEDLAVIEAAAKNAAGTVQRIDEFSRPSGGDTWYDVDLAAVVKDAGEFIRTRVPSRVKLKVELGATPLVRGNGAELREVLLNLLSNALEAIEGEGSITLRSYTESGQAVVEVVDTGVGMPSDVQRRIYEPFFSTKGTTGTGLGLSVSHGILRRHDAQIHLESQPGEGTRFRLLFTPTQPVVRRGLRPVAQSLSIAVVDDDPSIAELLRDMLEEMGHKVTTVNNVNDALRVAAERQLDLLVTDLDLPEMSGWQLARNVRRVQPDIVVGLITGWPLGASDNELKARGVDFVLSKPFTAEQLQRAIEQVRTTSRSAQ